MNDEPNEKLIRFTSFEEIGSKIIRSIKQFLKNIRFKSSQLITIKLDIN